MGRMRVIGGEKAAEYPCHRPTNTGPSRGHGDTKKRGRVGREGGTRAERKKERERRAKRQRALCRRHAVKPSGRSFRLFAACLVAPTTLLILPHCLPHDARAPLPPPLTRCTLPGCQPSPLLRPHSQHHCRLPSRCHLPYHCRLPYRCHPPHRWHLPIPYRCRLPIPNRCPLPSRWRPRMYGRTA